MIENIKSGDHLSVFVLLVEYLSECFFKGERSEGWASHPARTTLRRVYNNVRPQIWSVKVRYEYGVHKYIR